MNTVILTTFTDSVKAHMLQDILRNEGLESVLQGEVLNQVLSYMQSFDIRVLVLEDDLERAKIILKESFPEE